MRHAALVIVLAVTFAVIGLLAGWGALVYLTPAEHYSNQRGGRDEMILLVFGLFPLCGAAVGLAVGSVAAVIGLVSDHQRAKREAHSPNDRSPLEA
jgi:hypothetical protein